MLDRVALDRKKDYADIVIDFVPDPTVDWPELVEVSATSKSTRARLRVTFDELEVLAVALDSGVTGGEGELYFRLNVDGSSRART
jgi:hypothetical protein